MPIRPVEVVRTQEASQLKHMDIQRTQHAQVQQGKDFQNLIKQEQYKPTQATKSENKEYRYDAKEKGNNSYNGSGGKKREKGQEEKKEAKEPIKRGNFDILI